MIYIIGIVLNFPFFIAENIIKSFCFQYIFDSGLEQDFTIIHKKAYKIRNALINNDLYNYHDTKS